MFRYPEGGTPNVPKTRQIEILFALSPPIRCPQKATEIQQPNKRCSNNKIRRHQVDQMFYGPDQPILKQMQIIIFFELLSTDPYF